MAKGLAWAAVGFTGVLAVLLALLIGTVIFVVVAANSQAQCGAEAPTGPGPSSVSGIPQQDLPIFEGASSYFHLGSDGWAYLAGLNYDESRFATDNAPGQGVLSGSNYAGAAGPMQIGIGGQATDNWDQYKAYIPANLPGGAKPPSVYNEADAVYAAAAKLQHDGAPGDWLAALKAWNDYAPEIALVTQLVAQYTHTGQGQGGAPAVIPAAGSASVGCAPVSGPTTPGAVAKILPNGLAAIPQNAPAQVQEMIAAGNQIIRFPYSWGGGHAPASMKLPPGPQADPGQQENGGPGYDCSSAVSFVLWGGGLGQGLLGGQVPDSWGLETVGQPGAGRWVTSYAGTSAGQGHTFIAVAGIVMDTVHGSATTPAGTGPRWQPASELQFELSTGSFVPRHPQGL